MIMLRTRKDKLPSNDNPLTAQTYVKLFGFIPLLKIETRKKSKTFFLFYVLPVFRRKRKNVIKTGAGNA